MSFWLLPPLVVLTLFISLYFVFTKVGYNRHSLCSWNLWNCQSVESKVIQIIIIKATFKIRLLLIELFGLLKYSPHSQYFWVIEGLLMLRAKSWFLCTFLCRVRKKPSSRRTKAQTGQMWVHGLWWYRIFTIRDLRYIYSETRNRMSENNLLGGLLHGLCTMCEMSLANPQRMN